jgi:hypothetical protein
MRERTDDMAIAERIRDLRAKSPGAREQLEDLIDWDLGPFGEVLAGLASESGASR